MKTSLFAALAALTCAVAAAAPARADERLNVVELFQSQGCSSCPPANANVIALADRADVLALSFGVTYWDYLGWKDTFASPAFTDRQRAYARGLHLQGVYTPQVVVNGRADLVGTDKSELDRAIRRNLRPPFEPALTATGGVVSVARAAGSGDVWLVWFDPRTVQVSIQRGENSGRTLPHRNVVRQIVRLGQWNGAAATYRMQRAPDPAWRGAVLVQQPNGGAIVAAARVAP